MVATQTNSFFIVSRQAAHQHNQQQIQGRCRLGVFNRIFAELAAKGPKPDRLMIDATHLKAHRTAASLLKKGLFPDVSGARRAG